MNLTSSGEKTVQRRKDHYTGDISDTQWAENENRDQIETRNDHIERPNRWSQRIRCHSTNHTCAIQHSDLGGINFSG